MTRKRLFQLATICLGLLLVGSARAATWRTNVNYGASTPMDLYVPDRPATAPAVVVSLHYCGGNAGNAHGWFQSYADQYGFLIIAPKSAGSCFDAGLGRTGERANIVKMVEYVVAMNGADPKKVFAAGPSSGACMAQAMLASYPDVFAGGSSLAGVPAGAWTGGGAYGWSAPTSTTAQQWGDRVRNAYPGFTGPRPRVQFWHGQGDTNLTYSQAYPAQVAQWTNVFNVTAANATMESIRPSGAQDTWARSSYKDCSGLVVVEANSGPSAVPHDLTGRGLWADVVRFFGLAQGGTATIACGGSGGTSGSGGGAGGATGTGGATGAGGAGGRGGAGGATGTAGSAGGRGGSTGTGGSAGSGGTTGTGGATGSAGNGGSTGAAGAAGNTGSGGNASGSGGNTGAGGAGNTGGGAGTTGGSGGNTGSGGSTGAGGTTGAAGNTGGGNTSGSAGTTGTGGSTGAAGDSGSGNTGGGSDAPGWGCAVAGAPDRGGSALPLINLGLGLGIAGVALRRRRRAR